ncbi:MAG TPA: NAD(+) synthase [Solirubrobacteraceae bacterium]|jgi:NAD+ synthase (glutamine-hydrolysing)|nr:NAD(+) synthase [Solirubrobacteraceae bacterium]
MPSEKEIRGLPFNSLYRHGYARIAAAVPRVRIGDPAFNAERSIALARQAHEQDAALIVFPELGLSAYSSDDLFRQDALLEATLAAIEEVREATEQITPVMVVGAPLRAEQGLFNAAVILQRGRILGAVPKTYLPEYREFYEKRQFRAARDLLDPHIEINGATVPFGNDLLFSAIDVPDLTVHVEICEDVWAPIPPSTYGALAGATILANLSASNITVGKAEYRHVLCGGHSARTLSAYLYTAAGRGESTTDLAWDGQAMIYENGECLAEAERYALDDQLITADIDLDRLKADRTETSSWGDSIHDHRERLRQMRRIEFALKPPHKPTRLKREIERFPYVPIDPRSRNERCEEVYEIQVAGLQTRLEATGIEKIVIGVSGGLDSTHALIVAARAFDRLKLPRTNVLAYTMPGFGTSELTLQSARELMRALGVSANELDIRPAAQKMLESLGHPAASGEPVYDITYENVQAGERTSHLFRLANYHNALVLGTGDLSELALGWSTYGVGDQMSHYNVNASVPKTLIQFLLRWIVDTDQFGADAGRILTAVVETEISPELIPPVGDAGANAPHQNSEHTVGPYELQDFFLYHVLRFGNRPSKVAWLAHQAWGDREHGAWPDLIPPERRNEYSLEQIERWLRVFLHRFFQTSQFKRSASPNAPKVGSGGSLSPRGDWRAPSDGNATTWLDELERGLADGR